MGQKWDKFFLLMWKNWVLQYRKPIQTAIEILAPVLFSIILVVIRSLVDPELHEDKIYPEFCTLPVSSNRSSICELENGWNISQVNLKDEPGGQKMLNLTLLYSPRSDDIDNIMKMFQNQYMFKNVEGSEDSSALEQKYITQGKDRTFAAVQFPDSYSNVTLPKKLDVSVRFPGELRFAFEMFSQFGQDNWQTNLLYPIYQTAGPRSPDNYTGASPSYFYEGFLGLQHLLTIAFVAYKTDHSDFTSIEDLLAFITETNFPFITMKRFAYASWQEDVLLTSLISFVGFIIMLSFSYTCINTVKTITTEKEKQLKESMKIMGLPGWLHWTAWFLKTILFLMVSIVLITVLLKVKWYPNTDFSVFTYADPIVLLVFLFFYVCAVTTFCFAISVFFSRANTSATIAGLMWFLSYVPYLFTQQSYDSLSLGAKMAGSLGVNTAMAYGFQVILMYEGTGDGIQWDTFWKPNTPDDDLTLGLVVVMLWIDTVIYLLIALYVEAVFPGEYGVPQPWYYPFTASYWCGHKRHAMVTDYDDTDTNNPEFFEKEPTQLPTGIQIRNLKKVFGRNTAVKNLSLNMYTDQITVLLGHNGAGKTTTMSMLTGMIPPTGGTAIVGGYDIRSEMVEVRNSLGLCPQHNIIFDDLTVSEHIYFFSKLKGMNKQEIKAEIDKYVELLELEDKRDKQSKTLSGGMKRKLCVGMALCGNSQVVMLDEPTAGMDPSARRALWNLLQNQKKGRTMLLTTHFMDEADLLGDRIAIMAGGELQCCGSSFFLKKKYGAGYHLIMDKSPSCDAIRVTTLLKKYIPNIEINSSIGSELVYLLTENDSPVFEPMLRDLEEHSQQLHINSYGISLTTLEEVFMKVGADHTQEEQMMNGNGTAHDDNFNKPINDILETKVDICVGPSSMSSTMLLYNQVMAMLLKRIVSTWRSWILFLVQVIMPMIFLIITIVVARNNQRSGDLPAMPLSLDKYGSTVSLVQNDNSSIYFDTYKKFVNMGDHSVEQVTNLTEEALKLSSDTPTTMRRRRIAGAEFRTLDYEGFPIQSVAAYFNNDPYHSPGLALGLVLDAVVKTILDDNNSGITFTNHPLPYSIETKVNQILSGNSMGFQLAFNISFSMAFVSSFYVLFVIRERASNSKHLQFVSGVKVYVFWLVTLFCDLCTYLITVIVLIITLVCFQEDGYKSADEVGRIFLILLYFGWSMLPMMYYASYHFDVPSTGYTRMTLFSIFTGTAAFLIVQVLKAPGLDLENVGNALHWILLVIPHYSLATGVSETYTHFAYTQLCDMYIEACLALGKSMEECLAADDQTIQTYCTDLSDNYFNWESPGIGRNLLYSFLFGFIMMILILLKEYEVFSKVVYVIKQKYTNITPQPVPDEDSDVAAEKHKIRNTSDRELFDTYTMVLRDLTKFYGKFLAVNGLCLGVRKYECFGLLGVNGAGKTTTFKMMTGDEKISYGDGYVMGNSIKQKLKQVQKVIGYCPQFDALLDDMTARETLKMFSLLRGIRMADTDMVATSLAVDFDFHRHLDKKVKELSGGNKRKLSTSISLIGDPPIIYLDEPTTGMDPATKRYLWNALCKVRDRGKCIVLTSHSMEECEALCTRLAIMVNGNFKCLGSTQHLKDKFAEGYTITVKVRHDEQSNELNTEPVERFIKESFPSATIREKHQELITFYVTDKSIPWSRMFGILEQGKKTHPDIEDYSLGQSSLEQVFLTFTKHQM